MIVRDMFRASDDARVIARAIYEDRWPSQYIYGWITKYYAQLVMLKEAEVSMSNVMLFLDVDEEDGRLVGDVSGVEYSDVKAGKNIYYAMEFLEYEEYTAMYVPDYTIRLYGEEVIASEALREYGWNGYDKSIKCSDEMRLNVLKALDDMRIKLYPFSDLCVRCEKCPRR